jgi:Zn-dependent metalloprotease
MPTITTLSTTSTTPIPPVLVRRATYDAENSNFPTNGLGKLVRVDDAPRTGDLAVDAAHDNAKVVIDFYREVLGRNSIDNKGMAIESVVHFGKNYNNAYWDGSKMTYGDGDGKFFRPLSMGLDVVGHEITHGVAQYTAGLAYRNQSGALNESFSDVLGIPNKAAYDTALKIGSEKLAKIWYSALTDYLRSTSTFVDAARATYTASLKLYGEGLESQAVLDAWKGVGVLREPTPPTLMTLRGFDNGFKGIHAPHNPTMFPSDYRWT